MNPDNIKPQDFATRIGGPGGAIQGAFQIPNLRRTPFWRFFWNQQFVNRQHVFSMHHVGFIALLAFFWGTGWFQTAPVERQDRYYMNGAKYRLQSAYHNPGKRPAYKIAVEQGKIRYYYRGHDHAFSLNETKDVLWKLRENWLIQRYPGLQYPNVARQMMPTDLPKVLSTKATPYHEEGGH